MEKPKQSKIQEMRAFQESCRQQTKTLPSEKQTDFYIITKENPEQPSHKSVKVYDYVF
jgi:hypothetical protein